MGRQSRKKRDKADLPFDEFSPAFIPEGTEPHPIYKDLLREFDRIAMNSRYQVNVSTMPEVCGRCGEKSDFAFHTGDRYEFADHEYEKVEGAVLSIKRRDKDWIHDWRDLQRIKNEVLGPEWECVELYPAESRLVDGANQYWLWCSTKQFPFGFTERVVSQESIEGSRQRPFEQRPADLETRDDLRARFDKAKEERDARKETEREEAEADRLEREPREGDPA